MTRYKSITLLTLTCVLGLALAACGSETTSVSSNIVPAVANTPSQTTAASTTVAPTTSAATTSAATTAAPSQTTAAATTTASKPANDAIRRVNWLNTFQADPALELVLRTGGNPELTVKGTNFGGQVLLKDIVYLNLDGTGNEPLEEAVIPLHSGATAGIIGYVVFRYQNAIARYVTHGEGYKLNIAPDKGRRGGLLVSQPLYGAEDANCCPSAVQLNTFLLAASKLTMVASSLDITSEALQKTATRYYELLNARKFQEAYNLLSPEFQAKNPFKQWEAGFANTKSLKFEVSLDNNSSNSVLVKVTATDADKVRVFSGTWKLDWNEKGDKSGVVLHQADIKEVSA
jgi:guanyl-specific ribonuclease Sa